MEVELLALSTDVCSPSSGIFSNWSMCSAEEKKNKKNTEFGKQASIFMYSAIISYLWLTYFFLQNIESIYLFLFHHSSKSSAPLFIFMCPSNAAQVPSLHKSVYGKFRLTLDNLATLHFTLCPNLCHTECWVVSFLRS